MNLSRVTSGQIESHFDRALDSHLAESPESVMRFAECKNGAYRDIDRNRFVTYDEAWARRGEHSQACECGACSEVCDDE